MTELFAAQTREVVDCAMAAYNAGIECDRTLEPALMAIMAKYVAVRLNVTERAGELLLSARVALVKTGKESAFLAHLRDSS